MCRGYKLNCRPEALINLLNSIKKNENKVKAIKEIGFGGLLSVRLHEVNTRLVPWLLQHFNCVGHMLQFGETQNVQLYDYDVYDVFGLPWNKDFDVQETPRKRVEGDANHEMIQRWNEKFHKKPTVQAPTLTELESFLKTDECGDDFKRAFVVYVLGKNF